MGERKRRWAGVCALVLALALALSTAVAEESGPTETQLFLRGAKLWGEYCGLCHNARSISFGLLAHIRHQLRSEDSTWKAGKILNQCGGRKLSAGLASFQNKRTEIGAGGINRGGQPRATAPDNNHLFHE